MLKFILKYIEKYKKEAVIAPLFKFLEACMDLIVPLIMADIIDTGIKNGDSAYILIRGAVLVGLAVLGWCFAIVAQFFAAKAAMGFGDEVRKALYSHSILLQQEDIDSLGINSIITRITNDVNRVQTGINMTLRLAMRAPFIIIGAVIMSGIINPYLMIIYLVAVPLIVLFMFAVMKGTIPMFGRIQNRIDKISRFCRENLLGMRSVRAFRMQKQEIKNFDEETVELRKEQERAGRLSALLDPVNVVIINAAVVLVIYFGAKFVNEGQLFSGQIIALVNYLSQVLVALGVAANMVIAVNKAGASANRIRAVLDTGDSVDTVYGSDEECGSGKSDDAESNSDIALEFKNVTFKYAGAGENSLNNISFKVKKGGSLGIIGGTGCGKSTVGYLCMGMYPVTSGKIKINGADIKSYKASEITDKISYVPQKARLFHGSVRENMKWGNADATDDEIWHALDSSESSEFIKEKSGMLDFMIESGGRNLSGGQQQRLCIARALLKKREFIVLDDSTSALDFVTESKIRHFLFSDEMNDITKIIISQRISAVKNCDAVLVLDEGEEKGFGAHGELLKTCDVYREIYSSQNGITGEEAAL